MVVSRCVDFGSIAILPSKMAVAAASTKTQTYVKVVRMCALFLR